MAEEHFEWRASIQRFGVSVALSTLLLCYISIGNNYLNNIFIFYGT